MSRTSEAIECCKMGLQIDPKNRALKKHLEAARRHADLNSLFRNPELFVVLRNDMAHKDAKLDL